MLAVELVEVEVGLFSPKLPVADSLGGRWWSVLRILLFMF